MEGFRYNVEGNQDIDLVITSQEILKLVQVVDAVKEGKSIGETALEDLLKHKHLKGFM